jgi:gliding motility-associated-like protein
MYNGFYLVFLLLFFPILLFGQEENWMHPNKGQWDGKILYKVDLVQGDFLIEEDRFTYAFHNFSELYKHAHSEDDKSHENEKIKRHTVQSVFVNSSWGGEYREEQKSDFYRNYFLGKDTTKWVGKVHSIKKLRLLEFYPGIDLIVETKPESIKYSFDISPGVDPSIIQIKHIGANKLSLENKQINIQTRFGSIIEKNLKVWTESQEGNISDLKAEFKIEDSIVTFDLKDSYDSTKRLIIDPDLTFSTFTGSSSDNWGFTAAPDNNTNLFAGGIVFGSGYPISTGAYDNTYNGGEGALAFDIGISKFSADGAVLQYSTYIGGSKNETPNSIVTNSQNELFVLGVSSSQDFPITAGAYQSIHAGGSTTTQNSLTFAGTDIVVFKLSNDGTNLLASTFLGGSGNDGLNLSLLSYNYGDQFRGEIIVDNNGDVLLASSTKSGNFPTPNGSDNTLDGGQDAVVSKLSPDLTNLIWSTYLGGASDDTGFALQVSSTNNVYVTGGTRSSDMNLSNGHASSYFGSRDGYLVQLNGATSAPISGTYIGTPSYDQSYFVQLDLDDYVYVFGQSAGSMLISPGLYSNPNSGQFIRKYSTDLGTLEWSTVVGGGNGGVEISPTAFLVSNCNEIYYAGWGGTTNQSGQASFSTTNNFPTTNDAFDSNTSGNNFYVAVLDDDAAALNYATFMGGVNSYPNHVDGGTSRFDKGGRIYHAVCAACNGSNSGFVTTPGAYSNVNGTSSRCNLAAFKFDLSTIESAISVPEPFVCIPNSVDFVNDSQNGNEYFWDFGDGNTSTDFEPSHNYTTPGTYDVLLVVSDTNACFEPDSSYFEVTIGLFEGAIVQPPTPICPGNPYELEASGGTNYAWTPAQFLNDSTSATPIATVNQTTTFTVIVSDSCGSDTLTATLDVYGGNVELIDDLIICRGDTVSLWATGGVGYEWSDPADVLSDPTEDTVDIAPEFDTEYTVVITTAEGCEIIKTIYVQVYQDVPNPQIEDTIPLCLGDEVTVTVSGAPTFEWFPNQNISTTTGPTAVINTVVDRWYFVDFTNPCGTIRDSVFIDVIEVEPIAGNDTIVCPGEPANLWASGGVEYSWSPANSVNNPLDAVVVVQPQYQTVYSVLVTDENGCSESTSVFVDHFPLPFVQTSPDYYGFAGDEVQLDAEGSSDLGSYTWSPTEYLSCVNCQEPISTTPTTMTYEVDFIDENGCEASDDVTIYFEGIIYVPNTFTPDGRGNNEYFFPKGGNIKTFEMLIFNRWGEVVYESYDFNGKWDGTYNGLPCPDGTYVWKIMYEDVAGNKEEIHGHVNLLR